MNWLILCICWMYTKSNTLHGLKSEWIDELTSAYSCWIHVCIKNGLMSWLIPYIFMCVHIRIRTEVWMDWRGDWYCPSVELMCAWRQMDWSWIWQNNNKYKTQAMMLTNKKLPRKPQGLGISTKLHTYITATGKTSRLLRTNVFAQHILACATWANKCNIPALLVSTSATSQRYLGQQMQHPSVTCVRYNIPDKRDVDLHEVILNTDTSSANTIAHLTSFSNTKPILATVIW